MAAIQAASLPLPPAPVNSNRDQPEMENWSLIF